MKNDYRRRDFKIEGVENIQYYIKVNKTWVEVSEQVYKTCHASYLKLLYEQHRDHDRIRHFENLELAYPYVITHYEECNIIDNMYHQMMVDKLYKAISTLSKDEQIIVIELYFFEHTERQVAKKLHISQQSLHYKKNNILKKLRKILSK